MLLDIFFSFDKNPPKAAMVDKDQLLKENKAQPQDCKSYVKVGQAQEQNHA